MKERAAIMKRDDFHEIERARSALFSLDSGTDRATWLKIGMAAKAARLSFEDFHDWSTGAGNYKNEADCRLVWNSIKEGAVTAASLYFAARAAGWHGGGKGPANHSQWRQEKRKQPEVCKPPLHDPRILWGACKPATIDHEYIQQKMGLTDGLRVYHGSLKINQQVCDGALLLPLYTLAGNLVNLQFVILAAHVRPESDDRDKLFLPRCKLPPDACLIVGGPVKSDGILYVVEGIGQAWCAHQATGRPAVVCFGWGRAASVATGLRKFYPDARLVIIPDVCKENQAATLSSDVQGSWVELPPELGRNGDINDLQKSLGTKAVAALLECNRDIRNDSTC
jgi:hypothetical protein